MDEMNDVMRGVEQRIEARLAELGAGINGHTSHLTETLGYNINSYTSHVVDNTIATHTMQKSFLLDQICWLTEALEEYTRQMHGIQNRLSTSLLQCPPAPNSPCHPTCFPFSNPDFLLLFSSLLKLGAATAFVPSSILFSRPSIAQIATSQFPQPTPIYATHTFPALPSMFNVDFCLTNSSFFPYIFLYSISTFPASFTAPYAESQQLSTLSAPISVLSHLHLCSQNLLSFFYTSFLHTP
jgi:hypothetical protein